MTFFGFDPAAIAWRHSRQIWIYFLITVPLTLAGIVIVYMRHHRNSEARGEGDDDETTEPE